MVRVYFVSDTAQVELKVDKCKPLPWTSTSAAAAAAAAAAPCSAECSPAAALASAPGQQNNVHHVM